VVVLDHAGEAARAAAAAAPAAANAPRPAEAPAPTRRAVANLRPACPRCGAPNADFQVFCGVCGCDLRLERTDVIS